MRRILLLVTVALLALAIGVVGTVSASPDAKKSKKKAHTTLTVLAKPLEARVVDLTPQGVSHGDMRVVNAPLYNESGTQRIGRFDLFCVITDPADESAENAHLAECTGTYTLRRGEISAQSVTAYPKLGEPPRGVGVAGISGGTGKYAGVGGEAFIKPRGNKVISTFRFIG